MRYYLIISFSLQIHLLNAQQNTGINTQTPQATLDINGNAIIRDVPIQHSGSFYSIGINEKNEIVKKSNSASAYSKYLGFEPMAPSHKTDQPIILEDNYVTKISGTSIGACYGVLVEYSMTFIGRKFISASLQAVATSQSKTFPSKFFTNSESFFNGKTLESLAGVQCASTTTGHVLAYDPNTGRMNVSFTDNPKYYPNAGTFVIYNVEKIKQTD